MDRFAVSQARDASPKAMNTKHNVEAVTKMSNRRPSMTLKETDRFSVDFGEM
jgi:hypothetical protein